MPTNAAGGVLWRPGAKDPARVKVALVHRPRYDDWSLPKGKLKAGEQPLLAAVRETSEETGFGGAAQQRLATLCYRSGAAVKEVDYWSMRCGGGQFSASDEVDELRWHGPRKALAKLSYAADRDLLAEFLDAPRPTSIVILARHASAGKRSLWLHPDDLRPLDDVGHRDAGSVAALMPAFAPQAVYSADLVRCRETASPVAAALDLTVIAAPDLSDEAYAANPARTRRAFHQLAADNRSSYVCSQGGAIPGLLTDLGVTSDIETKKGAFWVLGMLGTEVLFADYYRRPSA